MYHTARLSLQVWNSNVIRDEFMGEHVIRSAKDIEGQSWQCRLYGRGKESSVLQEGSLVVQIVQSHNLYTV